MLFVAHSKHFTRTDFHILFHASSLEKLFRLQFLKSNELAIKFRMNLYLSVNKNFNLMKRISSNCGQHFLNHVFKRFEFSITLADRIEELC